MMVQERKPWTGTYGTFNSYALQLEGFDGWVELSQVQTNKDGTPKPAPVVGDTITGSISTTTSKDGNTYFKFKRASKGNFGGNSIKQEDIDYIIMMLEEVTLRRPSPENPTSRRVKDILPNDEDVEKPFDLSTIPF